jgi:hypothetical protein
MYLVDLRQWSTLLIMESIENKWLEDKQNLILLYKIHAPL